MALRVRLLYKQLVIKSITSCTSGRILVQDLQSRLRSVRVRCFLNPERVLGEPGAVLSLLKLLLSLPELGQVEGGDLLRFLNLLLVGLDLGLELVGKLRHLVLVLVVLILLETQFLDAPLRLLVGLEGLRGLALNSSQLNLHLANATLQLGHGVPASLGSSLIGLSQPILELVDLNLQSPLALLHSS